METNVMTELEKSIMSNDVLGFKKELVKKLSSRIMTLTQEDLWPVFHKAVGSSGIELKSITEKIYDDGLDFSSRTRRFKSQVIDSFVDEIIEFISKRRSDERFGYKKTVDIYTKDRLDNDSLLARTKNISASGMLIRSRVPLKVGEKLELKVRSKENDNPICFFGSVVRADKMRPSGYDVGVFINSISEIDDKSRATAAETVYRLSHMGHKGSIG